MSTVTSSTAATTSASGTSSTSSSASTAQEIEDQFLTLLIAQLQNQDPLDPVDNSEITSQMAQISTVSSLTTLNETADSISSQINVSQSMDAVELVGSDVLVAGSQITVSANSDGSMNTSTFGVDFPSGAADAVMTITDASGQVVRTLNLGPQDATVLNVGWDGLDDHGQPVSAGTYYASVSAMNEDGTTASATALTSATVESVVYTANGVKLDLGSAGQVALSEVYQFS